MALLDLQTLVVTQAPSTKKPKPQNSRNSKTCGSPSALSIILCN